MKSFISALKKNIFGIVLVVFAVAVGSYSLFSEDGSDMAVIAGGTAGENKLAASVSESESPAKTESVSSTVPENTDSNAEPEISTVPEIEPDVSTAEQNVSAAEPSENMTVSDFDPTLYTFYYTPSGKKWHLKSDCRYLKNSKTIYSGTYDEVTARGLDACSSCGTPD